MNGTLGWLHISDLHVLKKHEWRNNLPLKKLIEDLQCLLKNGLQIDLVLCTGDIGFGETKAESLTQQYAEVKAFFDRVLEICTLSNDRLFLVPGNHDIDRNMILKSQTDWFRSGERKPEKINQEFLDGDPEIKRAMERLSTYRQFITKHYPHIPLDNNTSFGAKVEINGIVISITGLNSAWTCADNDDKNNIWLAGEAQLHASEKAINATTSTQPHLRLALLHHPQDWLQPSEARQLRGRLEQEFDFLLHGHAHDQWVRENTTPQHIVIAAGAATGESQQEFGYNVVQLTPSKAEVHLRCYDYKGSGWIPEEIHGRTNHGVWKVTSLLNKFAPTFEPDPIPVHSTTATTPPVIRGHYGLDTALRDCSNQLNKNRLVAVFGIAGVGKSTLIEELHLCPEWQNHRLVQIIAREDSGLTDFFGQIANLLDIRDERPRPPIGETFTKIIEGLHQMAAKVSPFFLHIQRAHLWFRQGHWKDVALARLVEGISRAYPECAIILETRERPDASLSSYEVTGLPKKALADYLAHPPGVTANWTLTSEQRTYLFTRLGGGHGSGAHAYGLSLLVRLAAEKSVSPYNILKQYPEDYARELYDKLFRDLYENVLSEAERGLLFACTLYRNGLHYSHLPKLEQNLPALDASSGLIRRRLLTENSDWLYLHDLAAEQAQKLAPEDDRIQELHQVIANLWLEELQGQKALIDANIRRALEALYHLEQGGEGERVTAIAPILLGRFPEATLKALWRVEEQLIAQRQYEKVRSILEYILKISPSDHQAMRFLGECRRRLYGEKDEEALKLFKQATHLYPEFSSYWSNYGHAAIASDDNETLAEFLEEIATAPDRALNDEYVTAVRAGALVAANRDDEAVQLRQEKIDTGSLNPVFYNDHAKWLLDKNNDANAAIKVLELTRERNCSNDITDAIFATALEMLGREDEAVQLRTIKIDAGSINPAFYSDHAKWLLYKKEDINAAINVLKLARERHCSNDITEAVYAKCLKQAQLGQSD